MVQFEVMDIKDFQCNPFDKIGKEWFLLTAEKEGKVNTMTAAWGGLGVIWNCNVAYIVVRQSRYTKEMIDGSGYFTMSFFEDKKYRKMLGYMGTVSGRDEDKIEKAGLTVAHVDGVPYFEEAELVMCCRKMSEHLLGPEGFIDEKIKKEYQDNDYHTMYIGEVTKILKKVK